MPATSGVSMAESRAAVDHLLILGERFRFPVDPRLDQEGMMRACRDHRFNPIILSEPFPIDSAYEGSEVVECEVLICEARPEAFISIGDVKRLVPEIRPRKPLQNFGFRETLAFAAVENNRPLYKGRRLVALGSCLYPQSSLPPQTILEGAKLRYPMLTHEDGSPKVDTVDLSDTDNTGGLCFMLYRAMWL